MTKIPLLYQNAFAPYMTLLHVIYKNVETISCDMQFPINQTNS